MTLATQKSEDALQTTTPLGYIEPNSPVSGVTIIQMVVRTFEPVAHRGTGRPIQEVIAKHEADPRRKAALAKARAKLALRIAEARGGRSSLAAIRLSKGLSQTELGRMVGLLQPQIARLEAGGIATAGAQTILKLRDALGVTADEILSSVSYDDPKSTSSE